MQYIALLYGLYRSLTSHILYTSPSRRRHHRLSRSNLRIPSERVPLGSVLLCRAYRLLAKGVQAGFGREVEYRCSPDL